MDEIDAVLLCEAWLNQYVTNNIAMRVFFKPTPPSLSKDLTKSLFARDFNWDWLYSVSDLPLTHLI